MGITAIETRYKGYRFRSRLEARYAVMFDNLGIKWEYEKEGFNMNGVLYLPDFWLPDLQLWVEVKGVPPNESEQQKATFLARETRSAVLIAAGLPEEDCEYGYCFFGQIHGLSRKPKNHQFGQVKILLAQSEGNVERAVFAARAARFEHGENR